YHLTTQCDSLSLHDALPISTMWVSGNLTVQGLAWRGTPLTRMRYEDLVADPATAVATAWRALDLPGEPVLPLVGHSIDLRPCHRSEEHTSELQSRENLVCRL